MGKAFQVVKQIDFKVVKIGAEYEKVSDQGPVWVRSEDKIPGDFISTHDINVWLPECSLVP